MRRNWVVPLLGIILTAGLAAGVGLSLPTKTTNGGGQPLGAVSPVSSTCAFNGVQTVAITGSPTGGAWTLSTGLNTTPSYTVGTNPSAATLGNDLSTLNFNDPSGNVHSIGGAVLVTGTYPNYTITFSGSIYNQVPKLIESNTFTGGSTPTIKVKITPFDQTTSLEKLINGQTGTVNLPPNSCWEVDGNFTAGQNGANMFISDPNGTAQPTSNLINGGNLSTAINSGSPVSSITVTTSGHDDIPNGTAVALTNASGNTQSWTTVGDTPPNTAPATITVTGPNATFNFPATTTDFGGYYTQLPFAPLNATAVPSGAHLYVSDGSGDNQTWVTTSTTPIGGGSCGCFNVTGQMANARYLTTGTGMVPIPQISTITTDGSNAFDIPSGSIIGITDGTDSFKANTQDFTTTTDTPAGTTTININPVFPNFTYVVGDPMYVQNNFHIHGNTNLTINGNGASFVQTQCQPDEFAPVGNDPVLFLTADTGLTIKNLSIFGAFGWAGAGCSSHGDNYQKDAGIYAEGEVNLTLTGMGVFNTQGDLLDFQLPKDFGGIPGNPLNTNVVVSNSTFNPGGGGFHGLGVEAVGPTASCPTCGMKMLNTTWLNNGTEWADFEVDDGSTQFNTGTGCTNLPGGLCPTFAAQDNIDIQNNKMIGWCAPWLTSLQGAGAGDQEQNWSITGNQLTANCFLGGNGNSFIRVDNHPLETTPPQFWTGNWMIAHNSEVGGNGFGSTQSSGCGPGTTGQAASFATTFNVTIEDNDFPITTNPCGTTQYLQFMNAENNGPNTNLVIRNNQFPGATRVVPGTFAGQNPGYAQCGNTGQANGPDSPCP